MEAHITVLSNDCDCPRLIWWVPDGTTELTALEEAVYIYWELSPTRRDWRRELSRIGNTLFDYHGTEPCIVEWVGDMTYRVNL